MNDPLYKIGIIGYGVVGQGVHRLLQESVTAIYDPYASDESGKVAKGFGYDGTLTMKSAFAECDLIVISVMTKENEDGTCDMSVVAGSLEWASQINPKAVFLIKSTSVPSELEEIRDSLGIRLVFSPEYMGESKYFTPFWKYPDPFDMKYHDFQIFGGEPEDTSACVDIFIRRMGPHVKFHQTTLKTASLAKYMENIFFAAKVTFCNEMFDIAEAYGVDYNELRELWLLDSRISPMHTAVFPKDRGFGGKCYPKDLHALIKDSEKIGYKPKLLRAVHELNKEFRSKDV